VTSQLCCLQPKWSCTDIDPTTPGCQPFHCPPEDGYVVNQNNSYAGNPSLEVCCYVSDASPTSIHRMYSVLQHNAYLIGWCSRYRIACVTCFVWWTYLTALKSCTCSFVLLADSCSCCRQHATMRCMPGATVSRHPAPASCACFCCAEDDMC
jgi:hypothetical protein